MVRKFVQKIRRTLWTMRWKRFNALGSKHECYICKGKFRSFYPYRNGRIKRSEFMRQMNVVGSDTINFGCPYCHANDRERHLFLYFDRLKLWERFGGAHILHFAPERNLSKRIKECLPAQYVQADYYPEDLYGKNPEIQRVDATNIQFDDTTFEGLICNHVLEHVPDSHKALSEFYRILKPGGFGILQTPYSARLSHTIEDPGIDTESLRLAVYGQEDHSRLFGRDFFQFIKDEGFILKVCRHEDVATLDEACYFGINPKEDLILVQKPN